MKTENELSVADWESRWQAIVEDWVAEQMATADSGHGLEHVKRVVINAISIASEERAALEVVLPAAWLHDCVVIPKNSSQRSRASALAAESAGKFLKSIDYPETSIPAIQHCIQAHSFSANIACESIEASVVQDADRLEALGAIGLARCLMTGGSLGQRLYDPIEPIPDHRTPRDGDQSLDHFFCKLLGLHTTMKTESGRKEAKQRTEFLSEFLLQLSSELGVDLSITRAAIERAIVARLSES